jgi:hypothetical protein
VRKPELTGTIFPIYFSDILAPLTGWSPGQLPGWPADPDRMEKQYFNIIHYFNSTSFSEAAPRNCGTFMTLDLDFTQVDSTRLDSTRLDSTRLDSTHSYRLDSSRLTRIDLSRLVSTRLTRIDSTRLDSLVSTRLVSTVCSLNKTWLTTPASIETKQGKVST